MSNAVTTIKGTGIRCKGNVKNNFEQVPSSIFNYLSMGLISGNELAVYLMLLKYDNNNCGYAFPTTKQLAIATGISDKTVKQVTKRLELVGLIKKDKASGYANKNVYYIYLPHEKEVLERLAPHLIKELEQRESLFELEAEQDKQRLEEYNKQRQAQKFESPEGYEYDEYDRQVLASLEKLEQAYQR